MCGSFCVSGAAHRGAIDVQMTFRLLNASSRGSFVTTNEVFVNSFFSGIGGFDIAFEREGMPVVFQCEKDPFCRAVLDAHWPSVPVEDDITEVDPAKLPNAEIWAGGFPCQDVSVARGWRGRDGLKGKNSGLFFPFAKLIESCSPKVVVLENVLGLLNSHNGQDFALVVKTLSDLGYGVSWRVLNTRYFGAPQSRPRVFIVAWKGNAKAAASVLYENDIGSKNESPRFGFIRETVCSKTGAYVPEIAYCLAATSGRHTGTDWSRSYVSYDSSVRRLTPSECERLQGFSDGWTDLDFSVVPRGSDTDTLRYQALGNAVSVPVVSWLARRIKKIIGDEPGFVRSRSSEKIAKNLKATALEFRSPEIRTTFLENDFDAMSISYKWKSGGVAFGGVIIDQPVSPSPVDEIKSRLVDILDDVVPSERYFLSDNAAVGILRRVDSQNRKLFPPLYRALKKMASGKPVGVRIVKGTALGQGAEI